MPCDEPVRKFFQRCFSMEGFGTVVSGKEGPEVGPRIGERDVEGIGCYGNLDDGMSRVVGRGLILWNNVSSDHQK